MLTIRVEFFKVTEKEEFIQTLEKQGYMIVSKSKVKPTKSPDSKLQLQFLEIEKLS